MIYNAAYRMRTQDVLVTLIVDNLTNNSFCDRIKIEDYNG